MPDAPEPPLLLAPALRQYAWGDRAFLPEMLGFSPSGGPWAEAWYGAHPLAPATAADERLDAVLTARPGVLGAATGRRFGGLPYLLKLLAVARPLSVQVHPDDAAAAAGFAREEAAGVPVDAPERCFRDPRGKPELLVALTPFDALCGFRPATEIAQALAGLPEIASLLPPFTGTSRGLRQLLEAYFALPAARCREAWTAALARMEGAPQGTPASWARFAHRALGGEPDPGLLFVFLLRHLHLAPGDAVFLAPGVPHAYLQGAGVEVMASSDNVVRAGLTAKPVAPATLLALLRFDAPAPRPWRARGAGPDERYRLPGSEGVGAFTLSRHVLTPGAPVERVAEGPETLLVVDGGPVGVTTCAGAVQVARGAAALVGAGEPYAVVAEARATVFRVSVPPAAASPLVRAVRHNIDVTRAWMAEGTPPAVLATVAGSAPAQRAWQRALDEMRPRFRVPAAVSLHEDRPVNQAFGLLLLWERLRARLAADGSGGALAAFVFGEGTRASPWTEAEAGCKPALHTFVRDAGRPLSTVELALTYFAPVEAYLRRSGFTGLVVKWGDEVQIPTLDLAGSDPRLAGADVVRFVSVCEITEALASSKDWVGVDADGGITAFIPRRPLAQMAPLVERGWLRRAGGKLLGGVNLGSVALSAALLDVLLEEFAAEVADPHADRKQRPDLDPQLFTALTVATRPDAAERAEQWSLACAESPAVAELAQRMPDVVDRLRRALDRYEAREGRPIRMRVVDFGDQFWGDVGQHRQLHALWMALRERTPQGDITRALAGLDPHWDARGNLLAGATRLGPEVEVSGSVLVDVQVDAGRIVDSVCVGTRARRLVAEGAFDVGSTVVDLRLARRAGAYRVVADAPVVGAPGERLTTVFLPGESLLLRAHEDTDLRNRATTYDVPILGNPRSFAEVHAAVVVADPREVERRRQALAHEIWTSSARAVRRWSA